MNILIVKLSAVGDVVHTLPSLDALRRQYPSAFIAWLVEESAADLLTGHPLLDEVIVSRRKLWVKKIRRADIFSALRELYLFLKELRRRQYDLVIDFHGLFKSAVLVGLSRGKRKLGYDSLQECSCLFYSEKIAENMNKHAVDRYLDFAAYLGIPIQQPQFPIPITSENRDYAKKLMTTYGLTENRYIAVNPVALWPTKLWSIEQFSDLCDRIVGELGIPVLATGGPAGKDYVQRIAARMAHPLIDLCGKTSLRELAALYESAVIVVTTDSGPMHIAAAVGTPVIALFGPTDPHRTGPYGNNHTVIRKNCPESPCFTKSCRAQRCMTDISVEEVLAAIKQKWGEISEGQREDL